MSADQSEADGPLRLLPHGPHERRRSDDAPAFDERRSRQRIAGGQGGRRENLEHIAQAPPLSGPSRGLAPVPVVSVALVGRINVLQAGGESTTFNCGHA